MHIVLLSDDAGLPHLLRRAGYQVTAAATDFDVVRTVDQQRPTLTVLETPTVTAALLQLCRSLSRSQPALPIMVLTDSPRVEDRVTILDSGASDVLTKPCHGEELLARIRSLMRQGGRYEDCR